MGFDPHRQGHPCRTAGACTGAWFQLGDAFICQCRYPRCRRVLAVVTAAPPPSGLSARACDALLSTDLRPADDWPGCLD